MSSGGLVRTDEDVREFVAWVVERISNREPIAIDTETNGLDWWTYAFTRLVQFGTDKTGWAVPVAWWGKVLHHVFDLISESGIPVIFHNAKHDMHALEVAGCQLPDWSVVHDTAILHRLHRSDLSASLKSRHTAEVTGLPYNVVAAGKNTLSARGKELGLKGSDLWGFIPVDDPAYWEYGIYDTGLTRVLFDAHEPTRTKFHKQYRREMEYMALMYKVEKRGLIINEKYTQELQISMQKEIEELLFFLQTNGLDNPNSNDQVIALLENDFGFVPWEYTASGAPSVNKNVLDVLAKAGGMQQHVVEALIKYKRLVKWKSTYVDRFLSAQDHHGRLHASIKTMEARTGRSSVTNPPFQTLPSNDPMIRHCIKAGRGYVYYSVDYAAQEPRFLAHYGQAPALVDFVLNGDGDVHMYAARMIFGPNATREEHRQKVKPVSLGRNYGAGADTLSRASGLPVEEVEAMLPAYDRAFGLDVLKEDIGRLAQERTPPFVTTFGGRRVYAEEDQTYKLVNYLIQGSGADDVKEAGIELGRAGLGDYIAMPVHDEFTFTFPKDEAEGLAKEAVDIMTEVASEGKTVPFIAQASGPGKTWGDVK